MHNNGFMEDKDKHIKASAKGGKKKGVLKGWAYMKAHDPERLKEIIRKRWDKNETKTL